MPEGEGGITTGQIHEKLAKAHALQDQGHVAAARNAMQEVIDLSREANRQQSVQMAEDSKVTEGHPSHETVVDAIARKRGFFDKLLGR